MYYGVMGQPDFSKYMKIYTIKKPNGVAAGIGSGEFTSRGQPPEKLALWVISNLQGSLITSRIFENSNAFDHTAEIVTNYLTIR